MKSDREKTPFRHRLYVDTSVYLCVLLGERGSEALARETAGAELLSSVLLVLEARRNLIRLARNSVLTAVQCRKCLDRVEADAAVFALRDVTLDLCGQGVLPAVSTPRSLDLVHLRTAIWFHSQERIDRFLTMDQAQAQAARELGLPT